VLFHQLSCKCQGITRKDWAWPALFQICYLCSFFVIRVVLLLIVMFCVLFMCKCVLPPGVNPTAVDKYIKYQISNNDFSYKYKNVITISSDKLSHYSDKTMVWTTGEPQYRSGQCNETFLHAIAPGPVLGIIQPLTVQVPTVS
jgi:hypothetical protein